MAEPKAADARTDEAPATTAGSSDPAETGPSPGMASKLDPALRVPLRLRRAPSYRVQKKAKKIRVAEAVETGVEGLLTFLQRLFSTTLRVATRPRRGIRELLADRRRERPRFVLPLTYLAVGIFLLSLLGQTAGPNPLDWIWFAEEIGLKVTDALRKEFSLASVVD